MSLYTVLCKCLFLVVTVQAVTELSSIKQPAFDVGLNIPKSGNYTNLCTGSYLERRQRFEAWSEKWITVYRLKGHRLWTDAAIRRVLGEPQQQGKIKVFPVEAVRAEENWLEFQEWRQPRIDKQRGFFNHFQIPSL